MKRLFKGISAIVLSAVLLAMSAVTALGATTVNTGDSVEIKISVEDVEKLGSLSAEIYYDENQLDLLTEDTLQGMGVANTTVDGEILWAALFGANGTNFSNKTDVYSVILVAKQNIADVDSLIQITIKEAYNVNIEAIDKSHVSYSITPENTDVSQSSIVSEPDNTSSSSSQAAANTNSSTASVNSKTSSNASSKANTSSKNADAAPSSSSSSDNNKKDTELDTDSVKDIETDSAAESTVSIIESYDEAEFESVPPIKLDAQSEDTADSRGSFPKGAIIGIVVCLVVAAAGIAAIISKKKG